MGSRFFFSPRWSTSSFSFFPWEKTLYRPVTRRSSLSLSGLLASAVPPPPFSFSALEEGPRAALFSFPFFFSSPGFPDYTGKTVFFFPIDCVWLFPLFSQKPSKLGLLFSPPPVFPRQRQAAFFFFFPPQHRELLFSFSRGCGTSRSKPTLFFFFFSFSTAR